jgi:hypothetical protein
LTTSEKRRRNLIGFSVCGCVLGGRNRFFKKKGQETKKQNSYTHTHTSRAAALFRYAAEVLTQLGIEK